MDNTILKISADGSRLLYEYKIPGDMDDTSIEDMAVDSKGALIVAVGHPTSAFLPSIPFQR